MQGFMRQRTTSSLCHVSGQQSVCSKCLKSEAPVAGCQLLTATDRGQHCTLSQP